MLVLFVQFCYLGLSKKVYGIDMQLPIYWYLVKKGNWFNNPKFVGFYLEKILHGEIKRDKSKDYESMKLDNLKLVGYSTNDKNRLSNFDKTYDNSKFIKSKTNSNKMIKAKLIASFTVDPGCDDIKYGTRYCFKPSFSFIRLYSTENFW